MYRTRYMYTGAVKSLKSRKINYQTSMCHQTIMIYFGHPRMNDNPLQRPVSATVTVTISVLHLPQAAFLLLLLLTPPPAVPGPPLRARPNVLPG